jgi:hypothetical protein
MSAELEAKDNYDVLMTGALAAECKLRQAVTVADNINLRLTHHSSGVGKATQAPSDPTESDTP